MSKRKFRDDDEESRRKYLEQLLSSADDDEDEEEEPEEDDEDTLDDEDEEPAFDEGDESGDEPDGEDDEESDEDEGETDEEGSDEPDDEDSEPDDEGDEGEGESDDEDETDEEPEPLPDEEDWEEDGEEEAGESDEDVDDDYEAEEPGYDKGTRVLVDCNDGKAWLGTVAKVNKDGTLSINFDNGDKDEVHECADILGVGQDEPYPKGIPMKVHKKYLKGAKKIPSTTTAPSITWEKGMRVLVHFPDEEAYYLGTVSKVSTDKLQVQFDDGSDEPATMDRIVGIGRQKAYKKPISPDDLDTYRGETPDESNDDYVVNPAVEKALERVRELLERALEQQAAIKKDGPYQPSDFDSLSRKDKAAVLCLYGILSGTDDEKKVAYKKALKAGVKPKLPTF